MSYPYRARAVLRYKPPPGASDGLILAKVRACLPLGDVIEFTTYVAQGDILTILAAADDEGDYLVGRKQDGNEGVLPEHVVEKLSDSIVPDADITPAAPKATVESLEAENTRTDEAETETAAVDAVHKDELAAPEQQPPASAPLSEATPVPAQSPSLVNALTSDSQPKASGPPELPRK
jgi:myosin tail region-interacting protein MTI1